MFVVFTLNIMQPDKQAKNDKDNLQWASWDVHQI